MRSLVLTAPVADAELAADRLWVAGAQAVEERHCADSGMIRLVTVLAQRDHVARCRLGEVPANWTVEFVEFDERPLETWRDHVRPVRINEGLVIRPAWLEPVGGPDVLEIAIEPDGSFGLGDHPTTRLSAAAVDRLVDRGDRVLDVGCGSGVLSIVAAARGAERVTAIDTSELASAATATNAGRNGVSATISASTTPLRDIDATFDVVVANILAPTLIALAVDLRRVCRRTGSLLVSGVLADAHDHVVAALRPMKLRSIDTIEGWAALVFEHP